MGTPAPSGIDLVKQRLRELPKEEAKAERDPTLRRYIFNPFHEQELDTLLARHSGFFRIPAGVIFAVEAQHYRDTNYYAVGLSEILDASENVNQPLEKVFVRQPGVIAASLVRLFGGEDAQSTGFCELDALTGVEKEDLIIDMQGFFFPKRFASVDEALGHLEEVSSDLHQMDSPWPQVFDKLVWSHQMSKAWCEQRLEATKASIEERANGGFGKRQPSLLDLEICAWLGVQPPRALSKLDLGKKAETVTMPQPIIVQPAVATDGLERQQCHNCGEMIALLEGEFPPKCHFCKGDPRGKQKGSEKAS